MYCFRHSGVIWADRCSANLIPDQEGWHYFLKMIRFSFSTEKQHSNLEHGRFPRKNKFSTKSMTTKRIKLKNRSAMSEEWVVSEILKVNSDNTSLTSTFQLPSLSCVLYMYVVLCRSLRRRRVRRQRTALPWSLAARARACSAAARLIVFGDTPYCDVTA